MTQRVRSRLQAESWIPMGPRMAFRSRGGPPARVREGRQTCRRGLRGSAKPHASPRIAASGRRPAGPTPGRGPIRSVDLDRPVEVGARGGDDAGSGCRGRRHGAAAPDPAGIRPGGVEVGDAVGESDPRDPPGVGGMIGMSKGRTRWTTGRASGRDRGRRDAARPFTSATEQGSDAPACRTEAATSRRWPPCGDRRASRRGPRPGEGLRSAPTARPSVRAAMPPHRLP